jgi:hypothetical protein
MKRWWIGCGLGALLCALRVSNADERWRQREPPWTERFEGSRMWTPDREQRRRGGWPDQFTIDKPGRGDLSVHGARVHMSGVSMLNGRAMI